MILRNSQCHCSSSLLFTSLSLPHSSPDHLVFCSKMSLGCCKKPTEKLGEKSWVVSSVSSESGSWWPVGGCRPTDVARNSSAGAPTGGPRWSGGQVVVPPSIQLPGGVFGSSGGTMGMGRHCSAAVKGHMLRQGGDWGTCEQPEQDQQLPPQCMLPDQKCVFETQQENYLSLNGDRFSCYLD